MHFFIHSDQSYTGTLLLRTLHISSQYDNEALYSHARPDDGQLAPISTFILDILCPLEG